jgi:hypothetical protein
MTVLSWRICAAHRLESRNAKELLSQLAHRGGNVQPASAGTLLVGRKSFCSMGQLQFNYNVSVVDVRRGQVDSCWKLADIRGGGHALFEHSVTGIPLPKHHTTFSEANGSGSGRSSGFRLNPFSMISGPHGPRGISRRCA